MTQFLNAPVAYALALIGQDWASFLVSAGAVAGITSVLLVMLMGQPRIFFAMRRDGLLPRVVSKVHPRFGTPYITTIVTCVIVAIVAGFTQILADAEERRRRPALESIGNFVTIIGALGMFNGLCITLLAYMTELGVTTEVTAKWHEIGITPERADVFGLQVFGNSVVIFVVGQVLSKMSPKPSYAAR